MATCLTVGSIAVWAGASGNVQNGSNGSSGTTTVTSSTTVPVGPGIDSCINGWKIVDGHRVPCESPYNPPNYPTYNPPPVPVDPPCSITYKHSGGGGYPSLGSCTTAVDCTGKIIWEACTSAVRPPSNTQQSGGPATHQPQATATIVVNGTPAQIDAIKSAVATITATSATGGASGPHS